jgi:hypothetical protein
LTPVSPWQKHKAHGACIRLVPDNLNTHTPGAFYEVLEPQEAFDLSQRFATHYTPKKGAWLNMAEIACAALATPCLDRRIADVAPLSQAGLAWAAPRNMHRTTMHWRFSQTNARTKRQRHYQNVKKLI